MPLSWLVEARETIGPALVRTESGQLVSYVMFNAADGNEEAVMRRVRHSAERLRTTGALAGLRVEPAGRYLLKRAVDRRLLVIVPLVVLANFLLLQLAFRSLELSVAIFAAIPLSFAGGVLGLWLYPVIAGGPAVRLTTAVWVGFIALFGIAIDDGAVMATYLRQRFDGLVPRTVDDVREAVLDAGRRRIRPCLMTTATTLVSLLPILWSTSRGADVLRPMALPLFGGLVVSLLTLFTVPALYSWMHERRVVRGGEAPGSGRA